MLQPLRQLSLKGEFSMGSPAYQSAPTPVYLEISFWEISAAKRWSCAVERRPLLGYEYLFVVTVLESDESLYFFFLLLPCRPARAVVLNLCIQGDKLCSVLCRLPLE